MKFRPAKLQRRLTESTQELIYLEEDSSALDRPFPEPDDGDDYEDQIFQGNQEKLKDQSTNEGIVQSFEIFNKTDQTYLTQIFSSEQPKVARQSRKAQSNTQKILNFFTNSHICNNLPALLYRRIKNYFNDGDLQNKKRLNTKEFYDFIHSKNISEDDWNHILDTEIIDGEIIKSKKLGTCKYFGEMSQERRRFLIEMRKRVQKILCRSAKRVISRTIIGSELKSYLDREAKADLHRLDAFYEQSQEYSTEYHSLLSLLNETGTVRNNRRRVTTRG